MSEDQKVKTAAGKVPMSMIPLYALQGCARVFGYGAKKYAPGNWYNADDEEAIARYAGAFIRHVMECQRPDGLWDLEAFMHLDEESGLPAIDHALCGLIMIRAIAVKRGMLADPGPGKEPPTKSSVGNHLSIPDPPVKLAQNGDPADAEVYAKQLESVEWAEGLPHMWSRLSHEDQVEAAKRGIAFAEAFERVRQQGLSSEQIERFWSQADRVRELNKVIDEAQDILAVPRIFTAPMTMEKARAIYDAVEADVRAEAEYDFPSEITDDVDIPYHAPPTHNESGDSYLAHQMMWVWPTQRKGQHVYRIWDTQTGQYVETEPLPNAEADELQGLAYLVDMVEK